MFKSHFEFNFQVVQKFEVNFKFNFRMKWNFDFETVSDFDTKADSVSTFVTLIPILIPVFDLDTDFDSSFHGVLTSFSFFTLLQLVWSTLISCFYTISLERI